MNGNHMARGMRVPEKSKRGIKGLLKELFSSKVPTVMKLIRMVVMSYLPNA